MEKQKRKGRSAEEVSQHYRPSAESERLYREAEAAYELSRLMTAMRKSSGVTQTELATRVGCKQPFIVRLEGGGYDRCEIGTLRTFARALGYDLAFAQMFSRSDNAHYSGHFSCMRLERDMLMEAVMDEKLSVLAEVLEGYGQLEKERTVSAISVELVSEEAGAAA
jgi:transcriptional regulator with XRE-family HTH domain